MNNLVQVDPVKPDGVHHLVVVSDESFELLANPSQQPTVEDIYHHGNKEACKSRDDIGAYSRFNKWWAEEAKNRLPVFISSVSHAPTLVG